MALTLAALAAEPSLGLRVLTGSDALSKPIGWVHPTELTDPQAFLEGGELLLTTGLALDELTSAAYVQRLVEAGVAGVGFGVGLSHDTVPAALVDAAAEAGLPLLEVPKRTPFIAITRAVSRAVAADEYASLVRTGRGQQELTRAAVGRGGPGAVVRRLAKVTGGWVLLLDAAGKVTEAAPASARAVDLRGQVEHLRGGTRLASSGVRVGEREFVVQALDTRTPGYLAVGFETVMDAAEGYLVNTAASLLSLAQEQNREQGVALRRIRTGLAELLSAGQGEVATHSMTTLWGAAPELPWTVLVLVGGKPARRAAFETLDAESATAAEPVFFAELRDSLVVITGSAAEPAARFPGIHTGSAQCSSTVDFELARSRAEQAARAAQSERIPLLRFADYAGRGLLELVAPDAATAFAETLLSPLRRHDDTGRGDLLASLRCWLENHGHWDHTASVLGIHRHTLRNRIRKVEELTGRSLDAPGVRAEFWLALQVG
jgi:purine catabolism regulator